MLDLGLLSETLLHEHLLNEVSVAKIEVSWSMACWINIILFRIEGIALLGLVPIFPKYGNWMGKIPHIDFWEEQKVSEVNVNFPSFFFSQYWPLFVLFFYILSPIPYCIARRLVDDTDATSNACKELAVFLTTGIVVSAFGLPIVFARAELVSSVSISENILC